MEDPVFVNDENIPLVTHYNKNRDNNNNYDGHNAPNDSRSQ